MRSVLAWAPVSKRSKKVLRDLRGHYAIYTHRADAEADCPDHGRVQRITVRVIETRNR